MTLLIKNVKLLGALGNFPDFVDVFVSGSKISAIGNFPTKPADRVIEGRGAYLSPGFIDVNTDSDHYLTLFTDPSQGDFVRQGVTTIVGGNCGASLAPLLYGSLEAIQKWANPDQVNVDWHAVRELLDVLSQKHSLGVNFLTLVGHSTIRRAVVGEVIRDLTKNELSIFCETLKRGIEEGAFGFSTGLGYVHSRQVPYYEVKSLVSVLKSVGGIYTTHLRSLDVELTQAVDETLRILKETEVPIIVSHLLPYNGFEKDYQRVLDTLSNLPSDANLHFDLYPFDTSMLALYTLLPLWVQNGGIDVMEKNISDEWMIPRIMKDLPELNPHSVTVAQAPSNDSLVGRSLKDIMELYSLSNAREALFKLMTITKLRATVFSKNLNMDLIKKALAHPRALVASNSASFPQSSSIKMKKPERSTSTFTKFLALVENEKLMPLEDAIKKITEVPANIFNLEGRGVIREGNYADLAGFKNGEVAFTIVNGRVAFENGVVEGVRAGVILRHA